MFSLPTLLTAAGIEFERIGDSSNEEFERLEPLNAADETSLIFIESPSEKSIEVLRSTRAPIALVRRDWAQQNRDALSGAKPAMYLVEQPRLAVARILQQMGAEPQVEFGAHPTAIVDPEANIHPHVSIGPYSIVGKCTIGENTRIAGHVVIKDRVEIGRNVRISEFCMIGGAGFGIVRGPDGKLTHIPHVGRTVIEDDVELFPYVNVDAGTLQETRIKRGTKIDHYAHIGHNAVVGEDSIVTAGVVFCGKASLGDRSWLGVGSILKEGARVGSDVVVGLGSVVLKDVPDNSTVAGVPAKPLQRPAPEQK